MNSMSNRVFTPLESFSGGMRPSILLLMAFGPKTSPPSIDLIIR